MKESLGYAPRESATLMRRDHPSLQDLERSVDTGRVAVAEHEFTHIVAIWGMGKSVSMASVIPTSEYEGVTKPGGDMSTVDMQVAAMASSEHSGNGSDQMKAYILESFGGISMGQAKGIAKSIISSYRADVLHVAAMYLASEGTASDARLREYLRWAEDEVKSQEAYEQYPIPSWSDELDIQREEAIDNQESTPHGEVVIFAA